MGKYYAKQEKYRIYEHKIIRQPFPYPEREKKHENDEDGEERLFMEQLTGFCDDAEDEGDYNRDKGMFAMEF
jgi:hypothetical protein